MILTDSHCHLAMVENADATLEAARRAGVGGFIVPSTMLEDVEPVVALSSRNHDVWGAVGFHPHEARDFDEAAEKVVREAALGERIVAIGEIGLDYHYMHSPRETQKDVLRRQLSIAKELRLPVIIHNRESSEDLLSILSSEEARGTRGVLHSFTEGWEVARALVEKELFISFSGIITFKTAETLRDVARRLPRESVLIETDSPFLAPVPHRGKPNEPALVIEIAKLLGSLWGVSVEEVARVTTSNFERAFGVKIPE
ncbi:MAG TPA: TatD family hydrolase [Thermoanaerobaculia bacterium]|nr:TatD family hydrolase [Thermoanaerobaculia bacterium]